MTPAAKSSAATVLAVLALLVAFVLGGAGRGPAAVPAAASTPTSEPASGIHVSGVGEVAGTPDVLRLDMGVETRAATVDGALQKANVALGRVVRALKKGGVASKDIRTANLSVDPDYTYANGTSRITGYVVTESLDATLRDLGRAGGLVTAAVSAGGDATRVDGLRLDLEGDSELLAQARERAFESAKAKATDYADAAGRRLGAVTQVTEQVDRSGPEPLSYRAMAASSADRAVPVEPGSQQVSVTVQVVWSFA